MTLHGGAQGRRAWLARAGAMGWFTFPFRAGMPVHRQAAPSEADRECRMWMGALEARETECAGASERVLSAFRVTGHQ